MGWMLTTVDNPWNPVTQYESWLSFDNDKGYNTCGKIARLARVSDEMTKEEEAKENERAIDTIIHYDFMNIYKKIKV